MYDVDSVEIMDFDCVRDEKVGDGIEVDDTETLVKVSGLLSSISSFKFLTLSLLGTKTDPLFEEKIEKILHLSEYAIYKIVLHC